MSKIEEQRKDANDLTLNEIKSRLMCMDVDFDPNIKTKSYYIALYNHSVKEGSNRRKISNKLLDDASKIVENQSNKVRSRDSMEYRYNDNEGKMSKLLKKEDNIDSINNLIEINNDYVKIINKSRKNLNFINEERDSSTNLNLIKKTSDIKLNGLLKDENTEKNPKISLIVPKLMRDNSELTYQIGKIVREINFTLIPRKSVLIFKNKDNSNKNTYINITIIMLSTVTFILITYIILNPKLKDSITALKDHFPSANDKNLNIILIGLCVLPLIIYALNTYINNENIAKKVYNDVKEILKEIKNAETENFIYEEKLITMFSSKYDIHYITFEQNILPRVKQLAYDEKMIKVFQFNDHNIWKFK